MPKPCLKQQTTCRCVKKPWVFCSPFLVLVLICLVKTFISWLCLSTCLAASSKLPRVKVEGVIGVLLMLRSLRGVSLSLSWTSWSFKRQAAPWGTEWDFGIDVSKKQVNHVSQIMCENPVFLGLSLTVPLQSATSSAGHTPGSSGIVTKHF